MSEDVVMHSVGPVIIENRPSAPSTPDGLSDPEQGVSSPESPITNPAASYSANLYNYALMSHMNKKCRGDSHLTPGEYSDHSLSEKSRSNSFVHDSGYVSATVTSSSSNSSSSSSPVATATTRSSNDYYNQKKISKPMIEKRRRDRINRCLNLLKEIVIDAKRYPISKINKSRFEKADILETTVKYLESIQLEEKRIYLQGFDACLAKMLELITNNARDLSNIKCDSNDTPDGATVEEVPEPQQSLQKLYCGLKSISDDMHKDKLFSKGTNLSSLLTELNDIKSMSGHTSVSDSEQHSSDELLQIDQMKISEMSDSEQQQPQQQESQAPAPAHGVIRHTRNESSEIRKVSNPNCFYDHPGQMHTSQPVVLAYCSTCNIVTTASSTSSISSLSSFSSQSSPITSRSFLQQRKRIPQSLSNWNLSPFYTELVHSKGHHHFVGNERNLTPTNEDIWRPWGYGHR